jgi:DHA1 family tetracycline resistance protein-like MFS transporter
MSDDDTESILSDSSINSEFISRKTAFSYILPVLFFEYLAISLTRSIIPGLIVNEFGGYSYLAIGIMETFKGVLAFISCPLFGRLSDTLGRKYCLLFTVIGTTFPVCILSFTNNMYIYSFAQALSGFFSATFPLTFAYISDCVDKKNRAPAYGLALATFGLSFCIGPITGSYLGNQFGPRIVFMFSLFLVIIDVLYIFFYLPETVQSVQVSHTTMKKLGVAMEYLPNTWNISETFRVFKYDEFMSNLAIIVFLYYTSVWAIVSTLMVHVTRHLHFDSVTLGWLLSGYGVATMFSEGVVVRIIVPWIGEKNSMRLGLVAFTCQCIIVAFAESKSTIFVSIMFSMFANLVYPSVSSLVSKVVEEDLQGEALGALNGIKALTEGFGPLIFGIFMAFYENTPIPGAPYLLAALISFWSFLHCFELPPEPTLLISKFNARKTNAEEGISLLSKENEEDYYL